MLQFEGVIAMKGETQQVSEKFSKREFWLRDDASQYPQIINFQLSQDRCDLLDSYKEGDAISVNFNLRGRTWTNAEGVEKCFNSLDVWKINPLEAPAEVPPAPSAIPEGDDSDLPF